MKLTNAECIRLLRHVRNDLRALQKRPRVTAKQFEDTYELIDKLKLERKQGYE